LHTDPGHRESTSRRRVEVRSGWGHVDQVLMAAITQEALDVFPVGTVCDSDRRGRYPSRRTAQSSSELPSEHCERRARSTTYAHIVGQPRTSTYRHRGREPRPVPTLRGLFIVRVEMADDVGAVDDQPRDRRDFGCSRGTSRSIGARCRVSISARRHRRFEREPSDEPCVPPVRDEQGGSSSTTSRVREARRAGESAFVDVPRTCALLCAPSPNSGSACTSVVALNVDQVDVHAATLVLAEPELGKGATRSAQVR
jgi:hypothetical protein